HALFGNAINVGRPIAHDAQVVGADIEPANIVAPDDEDVGLFVAGLAGCHRGSPRVFAKRLRRPTGARSGCDTRIEKGIGPWSHAVTTTPAAKVPAKCDPRRSTGRDRRPSL